MMRRFMQPESNKKKWLWILILVLAVAAIVLWMCKKTAKKKKTVCSNLLDTDDACVACCGEDEDGHSNQTNA